MLGLGPNYHVTYSGSDLAIGRISITPLRGYTRVLSDRGLLPIHIQYKLCWTLTLTITLITEYEPVPLWHAGYEDKPFHICYITVMFLKVISC